MKVWVVVAQPFRRERYSDPVNVGVFVAFHLAEKVAWEAVSKRAVESAGEGWEAGIIRQENKRLLANEASVVQFTARYKNRNINSWNVALRVWVEEWEVDGSAVDALAEINTADPVRAPFGIF